MHTTPVQTLHTDRIHDSTFDFSGRHLATCSSDRTVRVFSVERDSLTPIVEITTHTAAVWSVSWAHPRYGSLIASASFDHSVAVTSIDFEKKEWKTVYQYTNHTRSVNCVAFAPHEYGLVLACASSDGNISIHQRTSDGKWCVNTIRAHAKGVNAVSWCTHLRAGMISNAQTTQEQPNDKRIIGKRLLASGGCDCMVKIWNFSELGSFTPDPNPMTLTRHTDWVRDVAFASNIGLNVITLASCSQDGSVFVWTCKLSNIYEYEDKAESNQVDRDSTRVWELRVLPKLSEAAWRVMWPTPSSVLAVTGGDNKVTLWKEGADGEWKNVATLDNRF